MGFWKKILLRDFRQFLFSKVVPIWSNLWSVKSWSPPTPIWEIFSPPERSQYRLRVGGSKFFGRSKADIIGPKNVFLGGPKHSCLIRLYPSKKWQQIYPYIMYFSILGGVIELHFSSKMTPSGCLSASSGLRIIKNWFSELRVAVSEKCPQ